MKMIRSTSTTSTSGVTLMSELRPPPALRSASPWSILRSERYCVLRFCEMRPTCAKPDVLHLEHRLLDVAVGQPRVALDDDRGVRVALIRLGEPFGELASLGHLVLLDVRSPCPAPPRSGSGPSPRASSAGSDAFGQLHRRPLLQHRGHDHEDDQQHQHTSTSGVTLMSERTAADFNAFALRRLVLLQEEVDQLGRGVRSSRSGTARAESVK